MHGCAEIVPFKGLFERLPLHICWFPPPPLHEKLSTIPSSIEQVVMIALAKDQQERFSSVLAFATALEQASEPAHFQIFAPSASSLEPTVAAIPATQHPWPDIVVPSPRSTSQLSSTGPTIP